MTIPHALSLFSLLASLSAPPAPLDVLRVTVDDEATAERVREAAAGAEVRVG